MVATSGDTLPASTLVVVAGQLDEQSRRVAIIWAIAQTVALMGLGLRFTPIIYAVTISAAFGGFQIFALTMASLTASERRAREELAKANAELHATRALLAESSRVAERLHISRDLHDTLGHHLTALSLQLDVASRLADSKTAGHITQAHAIARLLLGEVRDVVSRLRDSGRLDLARAIRALSEEADDLAIHVDVPDGIDIDDENRAHALLRCVQEIITNATRHSGARNLWITLESRADGITLRARDDGRGAETLTRGHGLTGMRERFEEHSGRVEFTTGSGRGFEVHGFMPRAQVAS
jgi:signal transduction histidine kinase